MKKSKEMIKTRPINKIGTITDMSIDNILCDNFINTKRLHQIDCNLSYAYKIADIFDKDVSDTFKENNSTLSNALGDCLYSLKKYTVKEIQSFANCDFINFWNDSKDWFYFRLSYSKNDTLRIYNECKHELPLFVR